jgi:hypothetical protein
VDIVENLPLGQPFFSLLDVLLFLFVGRGVTTHSHITGLKRLTVTFAARKTSELMDALFEQPREFVSKSITQTGTNKHLVSSGQLPTV